MKCLMYVVYMANVKVAVVVLGDIARSPRMLYHSYSLNKEGFKVKLIGCNETEIKNNFLNNVEIVNIRQPPVLSKFDLNHILDILFVSFKNFGFLKTSRSTSITIFYF